MSSGQEQAVFSRSDSLPEGVKWYVLHTRSRQEKAVARDLEAMSIPYFLPLLHEARYYGRRKAFVDMPLFPSYVFVRSSLDDVYRVDRTKRIARVIKVHEQVVFERELWNIHLALGKGAHLELHSYLQKGVWVEVKSGPFKGVQGIIEDRVKNDRLILQVDVLGKASSLEIDRSLLEPIDNRSNGG